MSAINPVPFFPKTSPPTFPREYYVYRHIRLDKNEVFYVGVATKPLKYNTFKSQYSRALDKNKRTKFWKNITAKSKYEVEIIYESENEKEILEKEIEFVNLYGRRDLGLGTLCNLRDGGKSNLTPDKEIYKRAYNTKLKNGTNKCSEETKQKISKSNTGNHRGGRRRDNSLYVKSGTTKGIELSEDRKKGLSEINKGKKHSEESRNKMSLSRKGVPKSEEHRANMSKAQKGRIISEEARIKISKANKGRISSQRGKILTEETKNKIREKRKLQVFTQEEIDKSGKVVEQYTIEGVFIKEWITISKASTFFNTSVANISRVLKDFNKTACGFKWKLKNINQ